MRADQEQQRHQDAADHQQPEGQSLALGPPPHQPSDPENDQKIEEFHAARMSGRSRARQVGSSLFSAQLAGGGTKGETADSPPPPHFL